MNRTEPRLSRTAASLVAAAALLTACSNDSDGSATPEPDSAAPSSSASFTLLSDVTESETPLAAGRYGLTVAEDSDPDLPWAVVEAPAGCDHFDTYLLECTEREGDDPAILGYWSLHSVRQDPCSSASKPVDTVEDAAAALRKQRYSRVSPPSPVTVDGYDGVLVELQIPEKFDFAACPEFHPWDIDAEGGLPYHQSSGTLSLWILDIDGDLAIIDVRDRSRLGIAMAESLELAPRTD